MKARRVVVMMFAAIALSAIPVFAAGSCESLSSLSLPNTTITMAQPVAAGAFTPPPAPRGAGGARGARGDGARGAGGARGAERPPTFDYKTMPAFCRVGATLKPTADSDIKIEVWLPAGGWNGKLQSVGNGAWAGSIGYTSMGPALVGGYAVASTDTGHTGNGANFVLGHPEKLIDYSYRSVHEMTVAAKAIVDAFYGDRPKYTYFNGCSTGGKQALTEAQRYPLDFDGIIAGASAIYATHLQGMQTWVGQIAHQTEAAMIPAAKLTVLKNAVISACDALDGVKDGVLEDPRVCKFDPKALECKNGDGPSCLTAPQVELARKIYQGPTDKKGKALFPGLEHGTEANWGGMAGLAGAQPMSLAVETFSHVTYQNPNWDYHTFDFERDVAAADKAVGAIMNSIDPNLKPFFDHGGKLLMYHGWADPGIPPRNSVNYYTSVVDKVGKAKTADSIRLFMVPGMGHCNGGDGTSTFDKVTPLAEWVEKGKAPDQIIASRTRMGVTDRTRPLCPYPQVAKYKGTGSTDDASNFVCKNPK